MSDTTGKPTAADVSKGSLQSSFASVIGAAVAATGTNGDAKLGKAQNVETKKTSSPESGKKTLASTSEVASVVLPAVTNAVPLNVPVPAVALTVAPQADGSPAKENATSTNAPAPVGVSVAEVVPVISTNDVPNAPKSVLQAALPAIADSNAGSSASSSVRDNSRPVVGATTGGAPIVGAAGDILSKHEAVTGSTRAPLAAAVNTALPVKASVGAATASIAAADKTAASASTVQLPSSNTPAAGVDAVFNSGKIDSVPSKTQSADAIPAIPADTLSTGSVSEKTGAPINSLVAAVQQSMPQPVTIPAQGTVVPSVSGDASAAVKSQSANEAATASKANISTGDAKQISENVVSWPPVSGVVTAATPRSTSDAANAPHIQSGNTISAPAAATGAQPRAAASQPQAAAVPSPAVTAQPVAATAQPTAVASQPVVSAWQSPTVASQRPAAVSQPSADSSETPASQIDGTAVSNPQTVDASLASVTQQAETIAVAVPPQSVDVAAVPSNGVAFKVSPGKSDAIGTTSQFSVSSKGRTSASDVRSNRTSATSDDKSSSTDTVSGAAVTRVVGPEVVSKEVAGNFKGAMESATLTQNAQGAQAAGQTASAPAPSAPSLPTPDSTVATSAALPAHAAPAESTQSTQALNSAQLIQSVHGSEMRLGMNSAEFGNISINTSINHQTLSAQILMDHSALGSALAMHLPAIEEKLGSAYGLQAKVELRDTATSNSTASDSNSSQSSGERRSQGDNTGRPAGGLQSSIGALTSSNFTSSSSSTSMAAGTSRLDIRI